MKECLFCEIIRGEKPAEFAYQDDVLVAFKDIHPKAPVHLLLVPRRHVRSIYDLTEDDREVISEIIFKLKPESCFTPSPVVSEIKSSNLIASWDFLSNSIPE